MVIVCKKDTRRNLPLKKRDIYGINAMDRLNLNTLKKQFQVLTAVISLSKNLGKYTGKSISKAKIC
jgi:hypothetical protein